MDGTGGSALGFPLGSGVLLHSVKLDVWETSRPCARRPASKATGKGSHPVHSVQLAVSGTWPRLAQDGAQRGSSQECPSLRFTGAHLQPPPSSPGAVASAGVGGVAGRRGVLGSVGHREPSRGSDHPQAPVGMPRPHCSPRAPPPSEACPQAGAGRPSGHSFRQELQAPLCGCQAFTRATAWVRPPFSSWASRVQVGGRWDPSLARPAASFPGDGPADANTWAKSRETRTGVPHWAHSEGRAVTLAGRTAGHERGSPAAP